MASASAPRFVKKREGEDGEGTRAKNDALRFARGALRSEAAMVDGRLLADFESVLSGNAIYLQNFHASARDYSVLANLAREMERAAELGGMVNWSKHLKHENPDFSETFQRVVDAMADYFLSRRDGLETVSSRLARVRRSSATRRFHDGSLVRWIARIDFLARTEWKYVYVSSEQR